MLWWIVVLFYRVSPCLTDEEKSHTNYVVVKCWVYFDIKSETFLQDLASALFFKLFPFTQLKAKMAAGEFWDMSGSAHILAFMCVVHCLKHSPLFT